MQLDYISLKCKDLETMSEFYETYFLAESTVESSESEDKRSITLKFPSSITKVRLIAEDIDNDKSDEKLKSELAFLVNSFDIVNEMTAILIRAGHVRVDGPQDNNETYYSTLLDPEKNLIKIVCKK